MRRLLAVSLLFLATSASAQTVPSFSVAADVGPAFPLGDFADDGAERGWSASVSAAARLTRLFGVYAGYERTSFDVEQAADAADDTWTDSGLGAGVRMWFPVRPGARLQPWAQLGAGWHDLDPLIAGPEFSAIDTDGILTLEGGAGLDVAVAGQRVFVRPAVRYRRYSFEAESPGLTAKTTVSSISFALGVMVVVNPGDDASGRSP
ncbi:MAG TPA: outer membrane beta-barrel protein [Longimicrobiales bacterium]|nr:outer membrane beta-barrel protein [Longimicrobiales bacterium]